MSLPPPDHPLVRLWQALWIDGDGAAAAELLTDPYVRHSTNGTHSATPADYTRQVCEFTRHLRGTEVRFGHLGDDGEIVNARFTFHGVDINTGAPVSIAWLGQYRLEDGRLAESWTMRATDVAWPD